MQDPWEGQHSGEYQSRSIVGCSEDTTAMHLLHQSSAAHHSLPTPLTEQRRQREAVVQLAGGQHRLPLLGLAVMQRSGAVGEQPGLEGAVGALGWVDTVPGVG